MRVFVVSGCIEALWMRVFVVSRCTEALWMRVFVVSRCTEAVWMCALVVSSCRLSGCVRSLRQIVGCLYTRFLCVGL